MNKECQWNPDANLEFYETSCKEAFEFTDAGPEENKFRFCPFCGGRISLSILAQTKEKE